MTQTILKTTLTLLGGHLLLGVALLVIDATHGISDQDASFAVALLFHYLNLPSIWLLESMGSAPKIGVVVAVGLAQWVALGLAIGMLVHVSRSACRALIGRRTKAGKPAGPGDAPSSS